MPNATSHSHQVDLETTFDFINTLEFSGDASSDGIPTLDDALAWLVDHGVLHAEARRTLSPGTSEGGLRSVHEFRDALRELSEAIAHGRPPGPGAIDTVNAALRAREVIQLEPAADGLRVGHRHEGDPLHDALARIAQPLVDELAGGRPERLRICANDECRWVFYDASPTARRRWCSMASCGNRAKAARHRARLREGRAGSPTERQGHTDRGQRSRGGSQPPSRRPRTSVARRVIDSSSYGDGKPAMRCR